MSFYYYTVGASEATAKCRYTNMYIIIIIIIIIIYHYYYYCYVTCALRNLCYHQYEYGGCCTDVS